MRSARLVALFIGCLLIPIVTFGQWRVLHQAPDKYIRSIHVEPASKPGGKNIINASYGEDGLTDLGVEISTDDGATWQHSNCPGLKLAGVSMDFKNRDTGWMGVEAGNQGTCTLFETTDGGFNWYGVNDFPRSVYFSPGSYGIYYNQVSNKLYVSLEDADSALAISSDNGLTWTYHIQDRSGPNKCVFMDSNVGVIADFGRQGYYTLDGGNTWMPTVSIDGNSFAGENALTPCLTPDGKGFLLVNCYDYSVYISRDSGRNWSMLSRVGKSPGQIVRDGNLIYVGVNAGVYVSNDTGHSWGSLCGPTPFLFLGNPLAVLNGVVYFGDVDGRIWMNRSGLPNGPRLHFESDYSVKPGTDVAVPLRTPPSFYSGFTADSVSVRLVYSNCLQSSNITGVNGWQVSWVESLPDGSRIHLLRNGASITPDSPIATLNFKTYLTPDLNPTIALDEINWDSDTTFRDCMVSALSVSDTAHIHILASCEDSLILQYMQTDHAPEIISVSPNPTSSELSIHFSEMPQQAVSAELCDVLGRVRVEWEDVRSASLRVGDMAAGVYYLRVNSGGFIETRRVVIAR